MQMLLPSCCRMCLSRRCNASKSLGQCSPFRARRPVRLQEQQRRHQRLSLRSNRLDDGGSNLSSQGLEKQNNQSDFNSFEKKHPDDHGPQQPRSFLSWLRGLFIALSRAITSILAKPSFKFAVLLLIAYGAHVLLSSRRGYTINVLYSEFVKQVEAGKVETVYFETKTNNLRFTYHSQLWDELREQLRTKQKLSPEQAEKRLGRIQTCSKVIPGQTDHLTQLLQKKQVKYGVVEQSVQSQMTAFLSTMFWLWVPLLPMIFLLRRTLDAQLGRKKRKVKSASTTRIRFDDVAGMDEAKLELLEVVELLKQPTKYAKLNAKVPSGVLLCGPTGTGKTLLARAVAGEAGVPFFAVSASEFVEMFVGRGAARIRELFREARKHTPCVVFIDEIDSVGGLRGSSFNEERDQTLNQLLVELDGFEDNKSIVLLAATNRFSCLDPALLRPGRLTRKINVPLPDAEARAAILAVHLRDVPMASLEEKAQACVFVGQLASGFSGAELANAVNEAALMAARDEREIVEMADLLRGLQRTKQPVNNATAIQQWLASFQQRVFEQTWNQTKPQRQLLT